MKKKKKKEKLHIRIYRLHLVFNLNKLKIKANKQNNLFSAELSRSGERRFCWLFDANKKIIAKNLSIEQFNDFLVNTSNKKAP